MRLAVYNVENLFDRPKAMNLDGVHLISVQKVTVRACPDREDWRGVYFDGARKCLSRLEFLLVR